MRRFNIFRPELGQTARVAEVAQALGADQIGARLHELAEGERERPYHFHHTGEEWLIAIAGTPRVRTPEGERVLERGDVQCFRPGPAGAHEVSGPGSVLIVSEQLALDAVEFPESDTVELLGRTFRNGDAVDGGSVR